ncbi:MAG: elongation factor G [Deltaproteobacteria bacterium]|nr:elongation factor G [Deltaproteobacteria bacterium]MBW1928040.1 elongation factor G [Deltaproteobacteria bacterium]MBW2024970.1 elongation factor G [Deltaproteobacteria bacterium]MBW2126736.1 elongation factor G [Deltaproteobacteria bacterium]RLB21457.1 MAG: elongation factor G [Deltaproteobacteria bacterium]
MERKPEFLRNVGLIAHAGSGKTSLAEAILFNGKSTSRLGKVDDNTSNMDFEPEEIARKITISTAIHHAEWKKHTINIIDTPGDDNFLSDTKQSLQAADSVVVVVDATGGVKVGTEKVWAFADELGLPRVIFINKLDRERADFFKTLEDIANTFEKRITPLFLPIGAESDFAGLVDLIRMKAYTFSKDGSGKFETGDIPADMSGQVEEWREKMIENIVEADDTLMEKYLEGEELSAQDIENTLLKGIKSEVVIPVVCGSALLNIGVPQLMTLMVQGLPSPLERPPKKGKKPGTDEAIERPPSSEAPFSSLVFKTVADPFAGKLTILRVFSGTLKSDSTVYNPIKDTKEKFGQLFIMEGKKQQPIEEAGPGDIVAIAKLKETQTGDTLCAEDDPIVFEPVEPLPAVISYAVEAKVKGSEDKVFTSLAKLLEEDPTLRLERDQATSEIILSGTGQIHLEATCDKLKRKFGVEVNLKAVKVPYRETIKKPVQKVIYRHKKQTGGRGQFAEVHFDVTPLDRGTGFEFEEALVGMNVPRNFVPAVEKGIQEALQTGILAGYPVVDLKVRFFDGKSHEVDSSEMAFKIAASMCLKKALQEANPTLLEPIMKMEITVPEEVMGDVIGDLNGRRGRVLGMESKGKYQIIKAQAPMAEILQYALDLNSMTGGRGTFTMEFSHYEEVPAQLAEKVIAAAKEEK